MLCYVLVWITGLLFMIIEKKDPFVRFHAMQSTVVFVSLSVLCIILWLLTAIPFVGAVFLLLNVCSGVLAFVLWVILMVKAYKGQRYRIPVAGDFAEKHIYGARARQEINTESTDLSSSRSRTLWALGVGLLIVVVLAIVISRLYLRQ